MIHKALSLIRVFHQMNQKDLAEKLEISRSYLSQIESGTKKPKIDLLEKYSYIFNVPISSLFILSEFIDKGRLQEMPKKISLIIEFTKEQNDY